MLRLFFALFGRKEPVFTQFEEDSYVLPASMREVPPASIATDRLIADQEDQAVRGPRLAGAEH